MSGEVIYDGRIIKKTFSVNLTSHTINAVPLIFYKLYEGNFFIISHTFIQLDF